MPTEQKTAEKKQHSTQSFREQLFKTRELSSSLAAPLSDEDQVVQSAIYASPTKWHLAHTTWFFEAFILSRYLDNYIRFNEDFEYCFNSYYNSVGERHPRPIRGLLTRPGAQEVRNYRLYVDEHLHQLLNQYDGDIPTPLAELIALGINHEQQHQELLLTDILTVFAANPLRPAYKNPAPREVDKSFVELSWKKFDGGLVDIGYNGHSFSYDMEGPVHKHYTAPYKLANRLVTNGEWLEFMKDGGYETVSLWLDDGWSLIQTEGWKTPLYWERKNDSWFKMSLRGLQPVDPNAPVAHISYYEADAFARWSGKRLPTEFEWEIAARDVPLSGNTLGSGAIRPLPAVPDDTKNLLQIFGDVWEWTQSPYVPYPGFQPTADAVGEYNGKFMSNKYVLRGGSCATPDGHIRSTYRNFFCPEERWQFKGLRLAESL